MSTFPYNDKYTFEQFDPFPITFPQHFLNVWSQNIQTEILLAMSSRNNLPKTEVYEQNTSVIALTCGKGKED